MPNEIWKNVVGWEEYYEVSNFGNVRSKQRKASTAFGERFYGGNIVKKISHKNGYDIVNLTTSSKRQQKLVHTLVLEAFVSLRPEKMDSCHNNGDRKDNRLENLRWDTRKNNHADKIVHGTWQGGSKNGFSKLNEDQARQIKYSQETTKNLAEKFNVSKSCIFKIKHMQTWTHV